MAIVNIEKTGLAIDPCGNAEMMFVESLNVELSLIFCFLKFK